MALSKKQTKIVWCFAGFCVATMLGYSGYFVLATLQSSINIEDGIGTTALSTSYITSALFTILATPVLLRKIQTKYCIYASQLTYLIFILANFYPAAYTLIPAAMLSGIGEAMFWPSAALIAVHYARKYALDAKRDVAAYVMEFTGIFFSAFLSSGIVGHAASQVIFSISSAESDQSYFSTNSTLEVSSYSYCGKYDCQDPNITSMNMESYRPASTTVLYILIGLMASLVILGIFINFLILRNLGRSFNKTSDQSHPDESLMMKEEKSETDMESRKSVCQMVKETFQHIVCLKQLLITPLMLYYGLNLGMYVFEFTRAYAACVLGIGKVSILCMINAACIVAFSTISTIIGSHIGRNIPMLFAALLDTSVYIICLCWVPDADSSWVVYVIFVMNGCSLGIWLPMTNEMHGAYFPKKQEIAFSVWNLYMMIGVAWQAAWTTSLCVSTKLYFQMGFLWIAMTFHGICVYLNSKKQEEEENGETVSEIKL